MAHQAKRLGAGGQLYTVGFSPDANYLFIGSSILRVIPLGGADRAPVRVAEGEILFGHLDDIKSLKSVGGRVFSAGKDGTVLAWSFEEARKGNPAAYAYARDQFEFRMKARNGKELTAMDASADGRLILTGGKQGQVQLWDAMNRQLIAPRFEAHDGDITAVAMAGDGSFFVTAERRKLLLWPGPTRWADIICQKLSWNMSAKQWEDWISESLEYEDQCENLPKLKD